MNASTAITAVACRIRTALSAPQRRFRRARPAPVPPQNDTWLASRLPVLHRPLSVPAITSAPPRFGDPSYTVPLTENPPRWESITAPLVGGSFESPWRATGNNGGLTYTQNQR